MPPPGAEIPTGLSVSSVYSPHGIAVTGDGATVYVVGQGGADFGGRVLPIVAATGATLPTTGFDQYGIADPAALAVDPDGIALLVVDSANNWVNPVLGGHVLRTPGPGPAPAPRGAHPTSGTAAPDRHRARPRAVPAPSSWTGFDTVHPLPARVPDLRPADPGVLGASSMAVAPAP